MKLLDESESWDLLSKTVYGEKDCPLELEEVGKKIGKSCKGLPLSIVVVGGLLAKSEQSVESWGHMEGNLNTIMNLNDDERCLKTLYMSYKQLSVHLKPCFLYMGIYRKDHEIRIPNLIRLWIAEGFLKPVGEKRLEDVARGYLTELIDRNLVLIHKLGRTGSIKQCKVHDLLRDLCLREAQKERFYTIYPGHEINDEMRRIVKSGTIPRKIEDIDSSAPLARSLILDAKVGQGLPRKIAKLARILNYHSRSSKFQDNVHQLVNSPFFVSADGNIELPRGLYWNLQALSIHHFGGLSNFWNMSHIRHLHGIGLYLTNGTFRGQWRTMEGQFRSLKFSSLAWCQSLRVWTSEASHFPRLEQLHLSGAYDREEIPLDFAETSTLGLINISSCCDSAAESAKRILEEQEALYGEEETTLQIHLQLAKIINNPAPENLRSPNFHVTWPR